MYMINQRVKSRFIPYSRYFIRSSKLDVITLNMHYISMLKNESFNINPNSK